MAIEIPDWDDMLNKVKEIQELAERKGLLSLEIDCAEAVLVREAMNNPDHFVNGKPPSMEYVKNAILISGFGTELIPKRYELVKVSSMLELARSEFELMKLKIDLYRTESANQRLSLV